MNGTEKIKTPTNKIIEEEHEAQYLGSSINDHGSPQKEKNEIIDTFVIWTRLKVLWKDSDLTRKENMFIFDAVNAQD